MPIMNTWKERVSTYQDLKAGIRPTVIDENLLVGKEVLFREHSKMRFEEDGGIYTHTDR